MAINFNSLPSNKPTALPANGSYYATIDSAEMKQGHDTTKPPYLNLALSLCDKNGKSCGKIYDILSESDKELVQYKLARFIIALDLANRLGQGQFELADLAKIVKGKRLIVDIKQEPANNGYPTKAVVDVFSGNIYYPLSEAATIFGTPAIAEKPKVEAPVDSTLSINAEDAADVHAAEEDLF